MHMQNSTLKKVFFTFLAGGLLVLPKGVPLPDSMNSPSPGDTLILEKSAKESSFLKLPASWSIRAYQLFISPTNGRHCQMYPSCSRYATAAIKKYGLVKGCLMASDRIHRCGHDLQQYKRVTIGDYILYEDPVH